MHFIHFTIQNSQIPIPNIYTSNNSCFDDDDNNDDGLNGKDKLSLEYGERKSKNDTWLLIPVALSTNQCCSCNTSSGYGLYDSGCMGSDGIQALPSPMQPESAAVQAGSNALRKCVEDIKFLCSKVIRTKLTKAFNTRTYQHFSIYMKRKGGEKGLNSFWLLVKKRIATISFSLALLLTWEEIYTKGFDYPSEYLHFRILPSERRSGGRRYAGGGSGSSVLVPLHVQGQVVRAGEAAVAHAALEGLGPRVFAVVSGQLVRAREPPVAAFPGALVRLLTCAKGPRGGGEGNWTGFGENQAVVEPLVLAKGSQGTATPEGDRGTPTFSRRKASARPGGQGGAAPQTRAARRDTPESREEAEGGSSSSYLDQLLGWQSRAGGGRRRRLWRRGLRLRVVMRMLQLVAGEERRVAGRVRGAQHGLELSEHGLVLRGRRLGHRSQAGAHGQHPRSHGNSGVGSGRGVRVERASHVAHADSGRRAPRGAAGGGGEAPGPYMVNDIIIFNRAAAEEAPALAVADEKSKEGVKTENNDRINLKVTGQDGSVVQLKIKRHTPLSKLMKALLSDSNLTGSQSMKQTHLQLEMEAEDTIDVLQQQTGVYIKECR
ncbi:hypothetical protein EI555_009987, partial [Monodon monoceros]